MRLAGLLAVGIIVACASVSHAQSCSQACDVNGDGTRASPGDYIALFSILGKGKSDPAFIEAADLDDSGSISITDFSLMLKFCPLDGADS